LWLIDGYGELRELNRFYVQNGSAGSAGCVVAAELSKAKNDDGSAVYYLFFWLIKGDTVCLIR
jgi:hypothetical protein